MLILYFYLCYTVHMDQVCLSNVSRAPPPVHFNPIIASAAPPLSSHHRDRGMRRSGHKQSLDTRLAFLAVSPLPPLPLLSSGFPYKQVFSTVSSVVPVERWKFLTFHSSSGCSTAFSPCITRFYVRIYHF